MYVRDLDEGILIKPSEEWSWAVRPFTPEHSLEAVKEMKGMGIFHYATVMYTKSNLGSSKDPAVYVGKRIMNHHYYGVKTQHQVLVNGVLAVMDGYSFRDVEKV